MTGQQLVEALENGVSQLPKQEGRFPQVGGLTFKFDSSKPAGQRVVAGSVTVGGAPVQLAQRYKLATKAYLADGKDGYDCLEVSICCCWGGGMVVVLLLMVLLLVGGTWQLAHG